MTEWSDFTVIAGGAAAALIGLLFVAVSIRADLVSRSRGLRSRLAQVLTIFLGLLGTSLLVSLPNPSLWILGIELMGAALIIGLALAVLNHRAERGEDRELLEKTLDRLNPNVTTAVLIGLSGIALLVGYEWGLFLYAAAIVVGFVGGVTGAWLVLVRPTD
jgi:hypothetical protein